MSFSNQIVAGLLAGVAVGLFLGEHAAWLKPVADGFVKLLQMTVLPYVTVSIISSLGKLRYEDARTLGLKAGAVLAGLWLIALLFAFLIPLSFPTVQSASFFSTTLVEHRPPFDFIDLYIPSNPFHSLANNIVPAVVLFSVLLGSALIGVARKQPLLDVLGVASEALSQTTRFVVRLTPYGLFAIAATAAGTLSLEQLGRLQVYLIAYVLVALLVALWVLPGLVAALTPLRMRDIFAINRNALLTAFAAGDLFIVLPVLIDSSRTLIDRLQLADERAPALPDVIVPASFNFPHTGKLLSISFILFAGWFADAMVPLMNYPQLALTGLVTFFGSLNVAIPFLLDLFRIPADSFQLFLASGVINSRFGTLVAAMHTVTVALLGTCAVAGALRWQNRALLRYVAITAALTVAVIGGTRVLFSSVLDQRYSKDQVLAGMHLLHVKGSAVVHRTPPPADATAGNATVLDAIRARGGIRVGYLPNALPFAFFNGVNDLVGFDVELAHNLASELGVGLEFVPVQPDTLERDLAQGSCDIVMSGFAVTTLRASRMVISNAYLDETVAFVVRDADRDRFATWDGINASGPIGLIVPNVPYYVDKMRLLVPRARILPMPSAGVEPVLKAFPADVQAIAFPAERGSAYTLLYPAYSVVVPEPGILKVPLGYPIARRDQAFATFINTWIELKQKDGTIDRLYRYWILGQDPTARQPRWSVIRNVLHWVE